jgi:muramidase (phage lysozyme)
MTAQERRLKYTDALSHPNLLAFLAVIRKGEGTADEGGYTRMFGGKQFTTGFADHPRVVNTAGSANKQWTSTAAGAYQFLKRTWDECVKALELTDFSPASQDLAACYLIDRRGALDEVLSGQIDKAILLCNREWASLPESPYGQPTRTMEAALKTYGEALGQRLIPAEDFNTEPVPQPAPESKPMLPFLIPALSAVMSALPELATKWGGKEPSEIASRNIGVASLVVDTVKSAIGASNEQHMVELLGEPAKVAEAKAAVQDIWWKIDASGISAARKANEAYLAPGAAGFWRGPAFWISLLLLAFPMMLAADVFFVHPAQYDGNMRTQVVTAFLAVIMVVSGYWIGSSASSARKTELAAKPDA